MTLDEEGSAFDVIIAGAGPAGCVLASRLSEDSTKRILLVEAGPDVTAPGQEHPDILDPFCLQASSNPAFHWPGQMAQVSTRHGNRPQSIPYIQGFGVGGASNINGMGVDRGVPDDYQEWLEMGADGWGWKDVLPYFRKLERDADFATHPLHGAHGPMPVRRLQRGQWAPFAAAIATALEARGMQYSEDYTGKALEGVFSAPMNRDISGRVSAASAYLTGSVRARPNLTIWPNTRALRVDLRNERASGLWLCQADESPRRVIGKEVVLACGALHSPTILMRSGIGPGKRLQALGIPVTVNLPGVGANLQNHPCVTLATYLARPAFQPVDNPFFLQNWARFSSGHSDCAPGDMHLMPFNRCDWHALGQRVGAVTLSVLKPYSKGWIELTNGSVHSRPSVCFNLLSDPRDEQRLIEGARMTLQVLDDSSVRRMRHQLFVPNGQLVASLSRRSRRNRIKAQVIGTTLDCKILRGWLLKHAEIVPERLLADAAALQQFVLAHAQPQFHVCGTCRMGRRTDSDAVVDQNGRVHGIDALRIVDASIFPTIPRAYTHFVVLMVAEKMADAMKREWSARPQ